MSEQQLTTEYARGLDAKQLIEHPLLVAAFDAIEREIDHQWKTSKSDEGDAREKLYLMGRLLEKLKGSIQGHVQTGKMAERQLVNLREKRTWFGT
jgi:hypothetical protein